MYAIIDDRGSQIKVQEGDVIRVALRELPVDAATITFDKVLMVGGIEDALSEPRIGQPHVEGAKVTADILADRESTKVTIMKVRRRKDYRRKRGHRQEFLKVKVTSIQA